MIASKSLIAADVDRTLLAQGEGEQKEFMLGLVNTLVDAAGHGADLAFLTGNSMAELSSRFLKPIIARLCEIESVHLLEKMHFFCNSSGVHAHFPFSDLDASHGRRSRKGGAAARSEGAGADPTKVLSRMMDGTAIRSRFLNKDYLERTRIMPRDVPRITEILEGEAKTYYDTVNSNRGSLQSKYDFSFIVDSSGVLKYPKIEIREVEHDQIRDAPLSVQITLKPVLSFRHAMDQGNMIGFDERTHLIERVQLKLDREGLGHYVARPGGRASVDVTLEKLDKSFGLRWLISRLNVEGSERLGQEFGSNTIYFGDEVIAGGGNDYAITKIPGVLVFAVNEDRALVPFRAGIVIPFLDLHGPKASKRVLQEFVAVCEDTDPEGGLGGASAIQVFRERYFKARVLERLNELKTPGRLKPWEWQALNLFVSLVAREDPRAQRWAEILQTQLDAISADAERAGQGRIAVPTAAASDGTAGSPAGSSDRAASGRTINGSPSSPHPKPRRRRSRRGRAVHA